MSARFPSVTACGATIKLPSGSAANAVTLRSISMPLFTGRGMSITCDDVAAFWAAWKNPTLGAAAGQ